jgi:hypothetical protein
MDFSNNEIIEIRASADNWGLFSFDFTSLIPTGSAVTDVTVLSYSGKLTPGDAEETDLGALDFPDKTAITLFDSDYVPTIVDNVVSIKLKYPGNIYKGRASLVFQVEIDSEGIFPFIFNRVIIK